MPRSTPRYRAEARRAADEKPGSEPRKLQRSPVPPSHRGNMMHLLGFGCKPEARDQWNKTRKTSGNAWFGHGVRESSEYRKLYVCVCTEMRATQVPMHEGVERQHEHRAKQRTLLPYSASQINRGDNDSGVKHVCLQVPVRGGDDIDETNRDAHLVQHCENPAMA